MLSFELFSLRNIGTINIEEVLFGASGNAMGSKTLGRTATFSTVMTSTIQLYFALFHTPWGFGQITPTIGIESLPTTSAFDGHLFQAWIA